MNFFLFLVLLSLYNQQQVKIIISSLESIFLIPELIQIYCGLSTLKGRVSLKPNFHETQIIPVDYSGSFATFLHLAASSSICK